MLRIAVEGPNFYKIRIGCFNEQIAGEYYV